MNDLDIKKEDWLGSFGLEVQSFQTVADELRGVIPVMGFGDFKNNTNDI